MVGSQSGERTQDGGREDHKGLKLYAVTVLRAHNSRKGRRKAADRRIYVLGRGALEVKDTVERGRSRVPGIKTVLDVIPLDIRDMIK